MARRLAKQQGIGEDRRRPPTWRLTFGESGIIVARGKIPVIELPAFGESQARGQPP